MAISMNDVLDDIGTALATIDGLVVFDFPPQNAVCPFAFVDCPEGIDYDATAGRGYDRMALRVFVAVAPLVDEFTRDQLGEYASAAGASSVKDALEGAGIGTSLRVINVRFASMDLAGTVYAGAVFQLDVLA